MSAHLAHRAASVHKIFRPQGGSSWEPIFPIRDSAPLPDFDHPNLGNPDRIWAYRRGSNLYGYTVRFDCGGRKVLLPCTWCAKDGSGGAVKSWRWRQWRAPRPLYLPAGDLPDAAPVILVGDEELADAGYACVELRAEYGWAAWPGSGRYAWKAADWSWLRGRVVVLLGGDTATSTIGRALVAQQGCEVRLCDIRAALMSGSRRDLAMAGASCWNIERVRRSVQEAAPLRP